MAEQEDVQDADPTPEYEPRSFLAGTVDAAANGRIAVNLDSKLAHALSRIVEASPKVEPDDPPPPYSFDKAWPLPLNVLLQVVGSRGDVQPFIALGNELQRHGHRVRLATHDVFRDFVQSHGLEFFSIGGDPMELMSFMVKNPGLIPNMKTIQDGEIARKRRMISSMLTGFWNSCISPDTETQKPFVAEAIIANPPSFAHIHCAQALGVPLHIVFTMPWTPTRAFPHPLANIRNSTTDPRVANYLSYWLVQYLTWQGLGDVINDWRKSIDLEPVPFMEGPFLAETLKIPHSYCWSPALVPKPKDWPQNIDVCGFLFRETPKYSPPQELETFLKAGPPPIYVGFGSIVVDNPESLINTVLEAIRTCGVRAIISKGWANLESTSSGADVFYLDDCPHGEWSIKFDSYDLEWLFQQVAMVVHHGGAGTTACGLRSGRPTVIVPFFGDQPFWGDVVAAAGAGPLPIPWKNLNRESLSQAITFCFEDDVRLAAQRIAENMREESGAKSLVASFHRNLPLGELSCDFLPHLPATWLYTKTKIPVKISGVAAEILSQSNKIKPKGLKIYQPKPIHIENRRWDPISGSSSSALGMCYDVLDNVNDLWHAPYKVKVESDRARNAGEGSSTPIAKMVGASAMTIPKLHATIIKGIAVDFPLALTEGFRAVPKLYGEDVPNHKPIVDWKSGASVAGSNFAQNLYQGLSDLYVQPYKGLKENGALGFTKGVGKGVSGTVTKTSSAFVGIVAYPGQGIYKSLYAITHTRTKNTIMEARRLQQRYFLVGGTGDSDWEQVLGEFEKQISL